MSIICADEKIIEKAHPSRWYFWQFYLAGALFLALALAFPSFEFSFDFNMAGVENSQIYGWINSLLFFLGPGIIVLAEILKRVHTYYITDRRVIEEFTFLSRRIVSAPYSQIQNVNSVQGLPSRMIGIGNLEFHTAGLGQSNRPEIIFRGIKKPVLLQNIIAETRSRALTRELPR